MFKRKQSKHARNTQEPFSIQGMGNADDREGSEEDSIVAFDGEEEQAACAVHAKEETFVSELVGEAQDDVPESGEHGEPEGSEEPEQPGEPEEENAEQQLADFVSSYKVPRLSDSAGEYQRQVAAEDVMFSMPLNESYEADEATKAGGSAFAKDASAAGAVTGAFAAPAPIGAHQALDSGFVSAGPAASTGTPMTVDAPEERKTGKIVAVTCGIILGLLLIAYCAGIAYFTGHMFPHTEVGDSDVSLMSTAEVREHLEAKTANYELSVSGYGYELKLPGENIKFTFDSAAVAQSMHDGQNVFAWPMECFKDHDYTDKVVASYDEPAVKSLVTETVETHNVSATDPKDARVGYDETAGRVVVIPEEYGTKLDVNAMNAAVKTAICSATRVLELSQDQLLQPSVTQNDAKLQKAAAACNDLTSMNMTFTVDGKTAFKAGLACIDQWIDILDDGSAQLNDEKISAWIANTAADYTTMGNKRTYTRADGKEVTVEGGDYGWEVDEEAFSATILAGLATDSRETVEMPFLEEGAEFNGVGQRDWGKRYIDVDMTEQHAYMYDENGDLIWETDVITGNINIADRATPEGVWYIKLMGRDVTLYTIESGKEEPEETLVYYWMPFVGNSVGLHDAWWQPGFGGTMYRDGYGSHGCVNLPSSAAADLYALAQVGDVVVTHW